MFFTILELKISELLHRITKFPGKLTSPLNTAVIEYHLQTSAFFKAFKKCDTTTLDTAILFTLSSILELTDNGLTTFKTVNISQMKLVLSLFPPVKLNVQINSETNACLLCNKIQHH